MRNIILITRREFLTQIKKKSFVVLTLLIPILIIGFGWVVSLIFQANQSENSINVIDKSGLFEKRLESNKNIEYIFSEVKEEQSLKNGLKKKEEIDGLLIIPEKLSYQQLEQDIKLLTNKNIGYEVREKIISDISEIIRLEKIKELGMDPVQIQDLDRKIQLNIINILSEDNHENAIMISVKSGMSMFLMYIIFIFIMMYGIRVMRSVLEEKNNRVVEILLSSVRPFELMMGKILGVTGVALLQFSVWVMMLVSSFQILGSPTVGAMATLEGDIQRVFSVLKDLDYGLILFVFVAYFLLGYLFYSAMYAAIGSAVDNETETQQFSILAILPMLLGFYGSITIMNNPDGPMSFWLSMIPFTSPIAMLARIPFNVPMWELLLSMGVLLISVLGMIFLSSKIYRMGILRYGNKATMKDLWKWMKS